MMGMQAILFLIWFSVFCCGVHTLETTDSIDDQVWLTQCINKNNEEPKIITVIGRESQFHGTNRPLASFSFTSHFHSKFGAQQAVIGNVLRLYCTSGFITTIPQALDTVYNNITDQQILTFAAEISDIIVYLVEDNLRQFDLAALNVLSVLALHRRGGVSPKLGHQHVAVVLNSARPLIENDWFAPLTLGHATAGSHSSRLVRELHEAFSVSFHYDCDGSQPLSPQTLDALMRRPVALLPVTASIERIAIVAHNQLNPSSAVSQNEQISTNDMSDWFRASDWINMQLSPYLGVVSSEGFEYHQFVQRCDSLEMYIERIPSQFARQMALGKLQSYRNSIAAGIFGNELTELELLNNATEYLTKVYFYQQMMAPRSAFGWCGTAESSEDGDSAVSLPAFSCAVVSLQQLDIPLKVREVLFERIKVNVLLDAEYLFISTSLEGTREQQLQLSLVATCRLLMDYGVAKSDAIDRVVADVRQATALAGYSSEAVDKILLEFKQRVEHFTQPPMPILEIQFGHAVSKPSMVRMVASVVVGVAVSVFIPGAVGAVLPSLSTLGVSAITGAVSGAATSLINKEKNLLKGVLMGAAMAGSAHVVSSALQGSHIATRMVGQGAAGCIGGEFTGGECKHGVWQSVTSELSGTIKTSFDINNVVASSIISGTSSGISSMATGGSFERGFVQGAAINALHHGATSLNDALHASPEPKPKSESAGDQYIVADDETVGTNEHGSNVDPTLASHSQPSSTMNKNTGTDVSANDAIVDNDRNIVLDEPTDIYGPPAPTDIYGPPAPTDIYGPPAPTDIYGPPAPPVPPVMAAQDILMGEKVAKMYVAMRPLSEQKRVHIKEFWHAGHRAALMVTESGRYVIAEYMLDSTVYVREVDQIEWRADGALHKLGGGSSGGVSNVDGSGSGSSSNIESYSDRARFKLISTDKVPEVDGYKWSLDEGYRVSTGATIGHMRTGMQKAANSRGVYNICSNNCHMSLQEAAQKVLGVDLPNKQIYEPSAAVCGALDEVINLFN